MNRLIPSHIDYQGIDPSRVDWTPLSPETDPALCGEPGVFGNCKLPKDHAERHHRDGHGTQWDVGCQVRVKWPHLSALRCGTHTFGTGVVGRVAGIPVCSEHRHRVIHAVCGTPVRLP